ncbi:MAG: F0F1 ATP synthase subunit B [Prevotellaceae bacterium]|jgi:F-type H+-transporting ATPase subunit b|nr:F0F1 ATP synthase subunit B [Prevotellaceae bacterium]
MALLTPDFGLLFWMLFNFLIVFGVLAKFGFPVITRMVSERRDHISQSLQAAEEATKKLENVRQESLAILDEARVRQTEIIKKAIADGEQIVRSAQQKAVEETEKQLEAARRSIDLQKEKALSEINAQVALLSVDIAEKILRHRLDDREQQESFALQMAEEAENIRRKRSHKR